MEHLVRQAHDGQVRRDGVCRQGASRSHILGGFRERVITPAGAAGGHIDGTRTRRFGMLFPPMSLEVMIAAEGSAAFDTQMTLVGQQSQAPPMHIGMPMPGQGSLLSVRRPTGIAFIVDAGTLRRGVGGIAYMLDALMRGSPLWPRGVADAFFLNASECIPQAEGVEGKQGRRAVFHGGGRVQGEISYGTGKGKMMDLGGKNTWKGERGRGRVNVRDSACRRRLGKGVDQIRNALVLCQAHPPRS